MAIPYSTHGNPSLEIISTQASRPGSTHGISHLQIISRRSSVTQEGRTREPRWRESAQMGDVFWLGVGYVVGLVTGVLVGSAYVSLWREGKRSSEGG